MIKLGASEKKSKWAAQLRNSFRLKMKRKVCPIRAGSIWKGSAGEQSREKQQ